MMSSIVKRGKEIILDKERALYIPFYQLLVISDLHLGKSGHFRKEGLQIPKEVSETDIQRLAVLVKKYQPRTLLVTGDMFHHHYNSDLASFQAWRYENASLAIILVKGNHDRLQLALYEEFNVQIFPNHYTIGEFCFVHEKEDAPLEDKYIFSGHLHPGILMKGQARQRLKLPCFLFTATSALLPAFSLFTGLYLVKPNPQDQVFVITENRVASVNTF
ncbi:ligase-associated DNA damage response endonuclease PdeM [Sphingobacterium sp. SRCM116780]|uniref:ligase-associated DNA damage response endonuclease PdeM n=1 Tax=Sphingobacterium sp. SRCM116780 TaxID=2907623 RepID=UPI001F42E138|nr:ligase-associated DNA damage response endonuclease PdeM [Sphingobacterium sp. SRCM116780]UIR57708.1 ligase-associated DNA damage response endonuclease PdeM [Sphingobacterium sp. SRCM116780]